MIKVQTEIDEEGTMKLPAKRNSRQIAFSFGMNLMSNMRLKFEQLSFICESAVESIVVYPDVCVRVAHCRENGQHI